jgi:hypothetical protein
MNFIKRYLVNLGLSMASHEDVVAWAYEIVKPPVDTYFQEIKWEDSDAQLLDEYLKSVAGQRFLNVITENKTRALQAILSAKNQDEVEKIKGVASAWIAVRSHLEVLRRKPALRQSRDKLSPEEIEKNFSRVMTAGFMVGNGSIRKN